MTVAATNQPRRTRTLPTQNGGFSVNQKLTPGTHMEAAEYASFLARCVRALGRRAESGDVEALKELVSLRRTVTQTRDLAAVALHDKQGWSWGEVALALGISRQAAQQRWGRS